jgi:transcriptional antiterminator NusG
MDKKWYVAHTYSGHEQKAKKYLENAIITQGLEEEVGRVLVPTETVVEMKHGKRSATVRKFLPSYILVEMILTEDTQRLVTTTPGITSFVGASGKPVPLKPDEVERLLKQIERGRTRDYEEVPFHRFFRFCQRGGPGAKEAEGDGKYLWTTHSSRTGFPSGSKCLVGFVTDF